MGVRGEWVDLRFRGWGFGPGGPVFVVRGRVLVAQSNCEPAGCVGNRKKRRREEVQRKEDGVLPALLLVGPFFLVGGARAFCLLPPARGTTRLLKSHRAAQSVLTESGGIA